MNQLKTLGLIMDGNRRWAREQGLPTLGGHRRGDAKFREVLDWAKEQGVETVVVYAFSLENWNRSKEELDYLMPLFEKVLLDNLNEFKERGVRIRCIGERQRFSESIQKAIERVEKETMSGQFNLVLAMSYGGRAEILAAAKTFAQKYGDKIETASEVEFASCLYTAGLPDPDLIIRTGGECRLSNFLPWQSIYSELRFIKTYWPALEREEFDAIIEEYKNCERRFGK